MAEPTSIVIPAYNQLDYCRQCIQSIHQHTRADYRLILVDNGSTDGVSEFFDHVTGAEVIHSATNLGFAGGVNLGIQRAMGHVLLLNSDTLVVPGWFERLEAALAQADTIGIVGPRTNYASGYQQIDGLSFASYDEIAEFARKLAEEHAGTLTDVPRLIGFCMLIRDRVIRDVGLFDETFGVGMYEDDDYGLRARRAGYRLCVAEDAFVFHYGNRTFAGMGIVEDKWHALMAENEHRFSEKWQGIAEQESRQLNADAHAALAEGKTAEALRLLMQAVDACPGLGVNHNDLGAILWGLGEHERAFDCFARAIRLKPGYEEARANLIDVARATGRMAQAEALLSGNDDDL
ncbi:MAG TPA: glycosyltransferase [Candidatus Hydrogenedentes bacterium]|nr:glycosyltransferase [Candidatus Hydrogenedentota bacterium]